MPSTFTHKVDLLTNTLTHVAPYELRHLKSTITTQTSNLLSLPFPSTVPAQVSLFHALTRLHGKYTNLKWQQPGLREYLIKLGARIVQGHVAKGSNGDTLPKLWADIEVLRVLPLIKEWCSLDPSSYALLNTRFRDMRDEIRDFLLQTSDDGPIDERLGLLGRVAEFSSYLRESAQVDRELEKLIRGYAHDIASGLGAAAAESSTSATVVKEEESPSPSPEPPVKRQGLASSTPPATTATRKEKSPIPPSAAAIKQTQFSTQSPLAALFAERAAREEAREKRMRDAERAEKKAKAKARQEAVAKDPSRAEQWRNVEKMKAELEEDALAKQRALASIEADKALRREKAEETRRMRLQELEAQKKEEKFKAEKKAAKEMKKKEAVIIEADKRSKRREAGMTRLKRLEELETQAKEEKAKAMKKKEVASNGADEVSRKEKGTKDKEVAAKLSAMDDNMGYEDEGVEDADDEE